MAKGFVFILTAPGEEELVFNELKKNLNEKKNPEMVGLTSLLGEYDICAEIESNDPNEIGKYVVDNIRIVQGVIDTKTYVTTKF